MRPATLAYTLVGCSFVLLAATCGDNRIADDDDTAGDDGGPGPGDDGGPLPGDDGGGPGQPDAGPIVDAAPVPDAPPAPYCTPTGGTNLRLVPIQTTGLERPVFVTAPTGDARLFVLEQPGRIRIIENGALLGTPFLDIADNVETLDDEEGLLGLAFHPQYASNGKFYVFYTIGGSQDNRVAEYTVSGNPNIAGTTEHEILRIERYTAGNHNGGTVAFGPDGFLYVSTGDGGAADDYYQNGQSLTTLHAKVLRIDVDHPSGGHAYGIPSTNPFAGGGGAAELFVRGLRNPWRFSVDGNGDLYIGDVGQGSREEVDFVPGGTSGQNFGWSIWEGTDCFGSPCSNMLDQPIADYDRVGNGRCSVIGGYVYRGTCIPDLVGTYLYGDYCAGEFYSFRQVGGEATEQAERTADIDPGGVAYGRLVSFGQDGYGELYVVTSAPNSSGAAVYRLEAE